MPSPVLPSAGDGPRSVDRALDLLDAVAEAAGPVSAKALARRLGCSLSTVYHLLGPLTDRGHVLRTPHGYALGHRVPDLNRAYGRQLDVAPGLREALAEVRRATGAEAYFTAYRGGEISVVDSTVPVTDEAAPFAVGRERRAHATAHGKVLLSALPAPARRRYLERHGMPRLTEKTITAPGAFETELAGVRRTGLAVSVGEAERGFSCVAVPLAGALPGEARALSVSLPTEAYPRLRSRIASVLDRVAGRLSG